MTGLDRRAFLRRAALASALAVALPACGPTAPDPLEQVSRTRLDALARGLVGFEAAPFADNQPLDGLRRRIAARLVAAGARGDALEAPLAELVLAEHAAGEVDVVQGWVLSKTEADLLRLSARLHAEAGTSPRLAEVAEESAPLGTFLSVANWGPRSTCERRGFNVQTDGHSSLWIEFEGPSPGRMVVVVGDERVPTSQAGQLLSTRIEADQVSRWFAAPGPVPLYVYSAQLRQRQKIGDFDVLAAGGFARREDGQLSTAFHEVTNWGPRQTAVGAPFNSPDGEASAFWVATRCAPPGARLRLGDRDLATTVAPDAVSGLLRGRSLLQAPARLPLVLFDPDSGESIPVGEFTVGDP